MARTPRRPATKPATRTRKPTIAEAIAASQPAYDRALVARQLAKVRALCGELPDTSERLSHGSSAFFAGKHQFAMFLDNHHGDGRLALWCAAPDGAQRMLVDSEPDYYFIPPYVGHRGWVGVRLDRGAPWPAIAGVVEAAHQARYKPPRQRR